MLQQQQRLDASMVSAVTALWENLLPHESVMESLGISTACLAGFSPGIQQATSIELELVKSNHGA